jgi:hypothetical protein
MKHENFNYEKYLQNILIRLTRDKVNKILERIAIHQEKFKQGEKISIPSIEILDNKENTTAYINQIIKVFEMTHPWVNIDHNGQAFVATLVASAKLKK